MDPAALIQLGTGAAGGLIGGNILGRIGKGGVGTNSLVGIIGGAAATHFFGPQVGAMVGAVAGAGALDPMTIVGNLLAGAGGGSALGLIISVLRGIMSR